MLNRRVWWPRRKSCASKARKIARPLQTTKSETGHLKVRPKRGPKKQQFRSVVAKANYLSLD